MPIFTDRVHSTREGYVLTRACPSVCQQRGPQPGPVRGGTPTRSSQGGFPSQVQLSGYPTWQGWGTPWTGAMGVPHLGYPQQGWGIPPAGSKLGYLRWGTPWQGWGTPPGQVWWGVPEVGYPSIGYLPQQDNRRSTWYAMVCGLLRSLSCVICVLAVPFEIYYTTKVSNLEM